MVFLKLFHVKNQRSLMFVPCTEILTETIFCVIFIEMQGQIFCDFVQYDICSVYSFITIDLYSQ